MNILLFLLAVMASQESPSFPQPEFTMKCYPEIVMPGDMLYVIIVAKNPFAESIFISEVYSYSNIRYYLEDSGNQQPLRSDKDLLSPTRKTVDALLPLNFVEIKPGDSHIYHIQGINVTPLADLRQPFWRQHLMNLACGDEKFLIHCTLECRVTKSEKVTASEAVPFPFEIPIVIKMRPEKEMALIRKWSETLTAFLWSKEFQKYGVYGHPRDMPKNIVIKDEKFSHWYFVRFGNLYPDNSSVPETWQGWKELEESLTPSTMRDEIRLTRILIQYCDTKDNAVLKELKDWFDGMNEVQRTVMARSVRDMGSCADREKLRPSFRKIYQGIREYDVVPIPESAKQFLRDIGLIE